MKKTMHVLYVRIGTEHEKFGFEVNTLRPMKYDQIAKLLNSIAERFEWEKFMEGDKIILSRRVSKSLSFIALLRLLCVQFFLCHCLYNTIL